MPNDDLDRRSLDAVRTALADATRAARGRTVDAARGAAALERLRRALSPDDERVRSATAAQERLESALTNARAAVAGARGSLTATLAQFVGDAPTIDLGGLHADVPLVLLPVRLETRVDASPRAPALLVRVYPDSIHGEAHDPLLTAAERDAGAAYWARAWAGDEAQAWRELVRQVPPPRAAWIVRAMEPPNIADRPGGEPGVPDVTLRAGAWDQPAEARLLPDRWLVLASRAGAVVHRALGAPVREPLAVSFDPHAPPGSGIDVSGDGLELDEELLWAVDFARAEEAGMGVRVPLAAADVQQGFDRILVLGVKTSLAPDDGAAALAALLDGHHYTGGLALVPQGTPTNNTESATSGHPPPDPDGAHSFAVERGAPLDTPGGDGARLMGALGLPASVVRHVESADRREEPAARAMNQSLWPVTFGYYLQQMLAPHVGADAAELARYHFVDHVRGRGPLPAFRVRGQPYGVLPVTSLDRWRPREGANRAEIEIPQLLRRLRLVWAAQIGNVPRVGRTTDADADLLGILGMDASTREVRVRTAHGPAFRRNLLGFLGANADAWEQLQILITSPLMALLGVPNWDPRLLHVHFADSAARFRFPLVAPAPLSEEHGLADAVGIDYVRWIREASIDDLREQHLPDGRQPPDVLLYRMLRHARLTELARVGVDLQVAGGVATAAERFEPELVGVAGATLARPTIWERFAQPIPAITGTRPLGDFLVGGDAPEVTTLREYEAALAALEGLPTAELERLFGETLDCCSHRFDAWVTSLASQRLDELRATNPTGAYVGAYGWVEGLRPGPASRTETLPDGRVVSVPANGGGHVQAPSMQHAVAAAVLRNGYLTRTGEQGAPFAVDLSSARVRAALAVLDTVRAGQPLGAALGYQLERGLHDRRLEWFVEPLRRRFPAVANKSGDADLAGPADAIAARSVVDGVALRAAFTAGTLDLGQPDFFRAGTPPTATERAAVEAELRRLDDAVDAVADLLTAESVFQLVGGNTAGANAGLDAMATGARPPEPGVVEQPRPGVPLTHRVALVLGGDPPPAPGWPDVDTPRARAEPWVDGWLGALLGDPRAVRCRARLTTSGVPDEVIVTLDQLALRPLDVLALARAASEGPAPLSELDARVVEAALSAAPPGARVTALVYDRDPAWSRETVRTVPDVLEVARAVDRLLAVARPLAAKDLAPADAGSAVPDADPLAGETLTRASQAVDALAAVHDALVQALTAGDAAAIDQARRAASLLGVAGAFPPDRTSDVPDAVRAEQAAAVRAELDRRVAGAAGVADAVTAVRAVFGRDFPFLPRLTPPRPDELAQSLAAGLGGGADAPSRWLYQAARVRAPLARWRAVAVRAGVLGAVPNALEVAQLPHVPGARWAALPFAPGAGPQARALSLVLERVAAPAPDVPWVGLLVDEWNEVIPDPSPTTGVAFHFDSPGSEPPQAVLVAVPPDDARRWSLDALVATLEETLELAKLRAVDGELLGAIGQLTPAVYLAANAANDTVSTDFLHALVADRASVAAPSAEG